MPITEQYTFTWHTFAEQMPKDDAIIYIRRKDSTICTMQKCIRRDTTIYGYHAVHGDTNYVTHISINSPYVWCYPSDIVTRTDDWIQRHVHEQG